jgi:hypothetical protein
MTARTIVGSDPRRRPLPLEREAKCSICECPREGSACSMCRACTRSYDRARARDDGTVMAALEWAARRARWALRKRLRGYP